MRIVYYTARTKNSTFIPSLLLGSENTVHIIYFQPIYIICTINEIVYIPFLYKPRFQATTFRILP